MLNLFLVRGAWADVVLPKTALWQFLTQALRNVTDPGWARGAPQPARHPVPDHRGSARRLQQPDGDSDMATRRRLTGALDLTRGANPPLGVDDPVGTPGGGFCRPRRPPGFMVLHARQHHRGPQSGRCGR